MTPLPEESHASFVDEPLERALLEAPGPRARAEFDATLRARFLDVAPPSARPAAHGTPKRRTARWLVPIGVAAGLTAFFFGAFGERAQALHWQVFDPDAETSLVVDGRSMRVSDATEQMLDGTHEIVTTDRGVRLRVGDYLVMEIAPQSQVTLSALTSTQTPTFHVEATRGSVGVCTGPAFPGSNLQLLTPDLEALATGTAFVANIDHDSTCVCCLEGPVVIRAPKSLREPWTVDADHMCRVFKEDKTAPKWGMANDEHSKSLRELRERTGRLWKR